MDQNAKDAAMGDIWLISFSICFVLEEKVYLIDKGP
jgi:hypothetical protein